MAQTWSSIIKQILLKGNFFAGDAAAIVAAYNTAPQSGALLTNNGAEFSFEAITDRILQAMNLIIGAIGENRQSEHRAYFLEDTAVIATGALIPTVSITNKPRFGVLSDVKDGSSGQYLTETPRELVLIGRKNHSRIISKPFQYYTDDIRIWHTRTSVKAEIVAWSPADERTAMLTNNAAAICPLPDLLLPALEFGSLGAMYRDNFNMQQSEREFQKFVAEINRIAGKQMPDTEIAAKV